MDIPETRYAITSDGVHIAYQVSGRGSIDLLWSEGWLSHVEILWEYPPYARWMEMLGHSFRVIHFDKRGIGLSDRTATPDLETRMEDVRVVLDAAGSERAVCAVRAGTDPTPSLTAASEFRYQPHVLFWNRGATSTRLTRSGPCPSTTLSRSARR